MKKILSIFAFLSLSAPAYGSEKTLEAKDVHITCLDAQGNPVTKTLTQEEFEAYKSAPTQPWDPKVGGCFTTLQSASDSSRTICAYYKKTDAPTCLGLLIGTSGNSGNPHDLETYAPHFLAQGYDVLLVSKPFDGRPELQSKPGGNFDGGVIGNTLSRVIPSPIAHTLGLLCSPTNITYGGFSTRLAQQPVADINMILDGSVTFRDQNTNKEVTVTPALYNRWVFLAQANAIPYEVQTDRERKGARLFDTIIADSPMVYLPPKWLGRKIGYSPLTPLQELNGAYKPVEQLIIRGSDGWYVSQEEAVKMLKLSDRNSAAVSFDGLTDIGMTYDGRADCGDTKVHGTQPVAGGIMAAGSTVGGLAALRAKVLATANSGRASTTEDSTK